MNLPLACTVRRCGLPLERRNRTWACVRGHSFDVARTGYVNLLQPQDKRSSDAGDSAASVEARVRLLASGVGRSILNGFVDRAAALPFDDFRAVVDLGCGAGDTLAALSGRRRIAGIGIDLSTAAADAAARAHPGLTWVVANADRRLPLLDQRVALVLSLHARRNPDECARVLEPDGRLIVGIPATDDLVELREAVQGGADSRERAGALIDAHASRFTLIERSVVRENVHATRPQLLDLLRGTYRGARTAELKRVEALSAMDVTLASELLLFAPRNS